MDLFRLVGSIFINNEDANGQIDDTGQKAETLASKVGSAFTSVGDKITGIGTKLAPFSAAMGAALGVSVKSASDFSDSMAKMSTLVDTSTVSMDDLSKGMLNLSSKSGMAAADLAEAGYQALSAGVDVDKSVQFVETASNLARGGFTSTTTAVDVLTTAMNAYAGTAGTAEEISNKLIRTQNLGKTSVDELASSMGKIIPTAAGMNVDINQLTTGYVQLTKQGIATAESTTYMNSMLNELGKSSTYVGGVCIENTGKSFQDLMKEGWSLYDILDLVKEVADDNGIAFNECWSSAEAGKAAMAILNRGGEEWADIAETMKSDTDDVSIALEKLETPSVKVKKAINQVKISATELGTTILTALTPALDKGVELIQKVTSWFSNLDDKNKTLIASVMGIGAAASPVLIVGGKIISGIGNLITTISTLSASVGGLSGLIGALTNPVTLVIAAVAGLIAIFVHLYKTNEEFRDKCTNLWDSIKTLLGQLFEDIKGLISAFVNVAQKFWNAWGEDLMRVANVAFDFIATFITSTLEFIHGIIQIVTALINGDWSKAWELVKTTLSKAWENIKKLVDQGLKLILELCKTVLEMLKALFDKVWTAIKDALSKVWDQIKTVITNALNKVKENITAELTKIKNKFNEIWTSVSNALSKVWETIKNVVKVGIMFIVELVKAAFNLITLPFRFIWENCKDTIYEIWDAIKEKVDNVINKIKDIINKVWTAVSVLFTAIWTPIKNFISETWDAISSKISSVAESIRNKIETVWNTIKSAVERIVNSIKSVIETVFNAIKSVIDTVMNAIKSVVSSVWDSIKSAVSNAVNNVKDTVSNGMNSASNAVGNVLNNIKSKFESIFNSVKETVHNAIENIKSKFNFSWSLPQLKMPHPRISGSFSLNPPSVPSFSIDWYAKAMDEPIMFTKPTVFGVNPITGTAKAAGEAGDEIMIGKNRMMSMIQDAVSVEMAGFTHSITSILEKIFKILCDYIPEMKNMQVVLDSGALVGSLTGAMDKSLGRQVTQKGRWN